MTWLLATDSAIGPFNATAPEPLTNAEFSKQLGEALGRPSWLPVPAPALRLALGEMADGMLLIGQRAKPARALTGGFRFGYADLREALREILGGELDAVVPSSSFFVLSCSLFVVRRLAFVSVVSRARSRLSVLLGSIIGLAATTSPSTRPLSLSLVLRPSFLVPRSSSLVVVYA